MVKEVATSILKRILLILTLSFLEVEAQNFFTSNTAALSVLDAERKVVGLLTSYIQEVQEKIKYLQKYVDRYSEIYGPESNYMDGIHNPIDSYLLLKRTTSDLNDVRNVLKSDSAEYLLYNLNVMAENRELPTDEDLQGAAMGLLRLQHTYSLDTKALSDGYFDNGNFTIKPVNKNVSQLSARDCIYLANNLLYHGDAKRAFVWFEVAVEKAKMPVVDTFSLPMTDFELESYIVEAKKVMNEERVNGHTENLDGVSGGMDDTEVFIPILYDDTIEEKQMTEQFSRLCRGERLRPVSLERNLVCRYFAGYHPFYLIQPLKMEVVSQNPFITIFYEIINETEILTLKEMASPKLERSVHYSIDGQFMSSLKRTSNNAWLHSDDSPVLMEITVKIEHLLGLNALEVKGATEMYQVANYGIGGHYTPHQDYIQTAFNNSDLEGEDSLVGDRIATLMFYLTDVEAGGSTVFPFVGAAIRPKKGSAVFWWNLRKDGLGDPMTFHGACPVLYGTKWVSNKWFRSHEQMFLRKCGQSPEELYNGI